MTKRLRRYAIQACLILLWMSAIAAVYAFLHAEGVHLRHLSRYIKQETLEAGVWGPAFLFFAYQAVTIIPFPTAALAFVAGSVYGPVWGSIIVVVSMNVASWVSFAIARFFGRTIPTSSRGRWLKSFDVWMQEDGFVAVLVARLLYIPFEYVGVAAGLSPLLFRQYAVASLLGMLPSTVTFVVLGGSFTNPRAWILFGVLVAFTAFVAVWFYRASIKRRQPHV